MRLVSPSDTPTRAAPRRVRAAGSQLPLGLRARSRAPLALVLLGTRYCTTLAPVVRAEVRRWERSAARIESDPRRDLAFAKLRAERFNAEAAAMLATLAPTTHRRLATRAIVALELLYDYLDGLTERPLVEPVLDPRALFAAFVYSVEPGASLDAIDDGYLRALARSVQDALRVLPSYDAVAAVAKRCALRGAEAQILMHSSAFEQTDALEAWARSQAPQARMPWREFLAGAACSVLVLHALIVAAADPTTTRTRADELEATYLPVAAAMTLLDGVIDWERDTRAGEVSYARLYEHEQQLPAALRQLAAAARDACTQMRDGHRHEAVLLGAFAYWLSREEASSPLGAAVRRELLVEFGPPLLGHIHALEAWRVGRRIGTRVADGRRSGGWRRQR